MNTLLADKVIPVTGGSSGIGRATAVALARAGDGGERAGPVKALYPTGRVSALSEVADTVVSLFSNAATFIHGHALPIDGGLLAQ